MKFIDKTHIDKLHSLISESSLIAIIGHTHPDGDSIGSALAMSSYLKANGKDTIAIFPNSIEESLKFMLEYNKNVIIFSDDNAKARKYLNSSDLII